jgi:hypothetical protein
VIRATRGVLCLLLCAAGYAAIAQPAYTYVDLRQAYGVGAIITDMNDSGSIIGGGSGGDGGGWIIDGAGFRHLPLVNGWQPVTPRAINNAGDILVASYNGFRNDTLIYRNGVYTDIGVRGTYEYGAGRDINDSGVVVGGGGGVGYHAFRWENGVTTFLPDLGGAWASAVNSEGVVCGYNTVGSSQPNAAKWTSAGLVNLTPPATRWGWARDINDAGVAVGEHEATGTGAHRATMWLADNTEVILGDFGGGTGVSRAWAVNDSNQAVGYATDATGRSFGAYWANGNTYKLIDLLPAGHGYSAGPGVAINGSGWILTHAFDGTYSTALLMKPVPEPDSILIVVAGVGLAILRRRPRPLVPNRNPNARGGNRGDGRAGVRARAPTWSERMAGPFPLRNQRSTRVRNLDLRFARRRQRLGTRQLPVHLPGFRLPGHRRRERYPNGKRALLLDVPVQPADGQPHEDDHRRNELREAMGGRLLCDVPPGQDTGCRWHDPRRLQQPDRNCRTQSLDVSNLNDPGKWTSRASLSRPRVDHNMVLLPDGSVFVVGGSGSVIGDTEVLGQAAYANAFNQRITIPEIGTVDANGDWTWKDCAPSDPAIYRGYHSTAMLLPDGRVVVAGSDIGYNFDLSGGPYSHLPTAQIFSPNYCFAAARPTITSGPDVLYVGLTMHNNITVSDPACNKACLIALGSVTHGFDMNQRYIPLSLTGSGTTKTVASPATAVQAPYGWYMLFVLKPDGEGGYTPCQLAKYVEVVPGMEDF